MSIKIQMKDNTENVFPNPNSRLIGKTIAIYGDSWATSNYGSLGKAYIESVTGETVHVVGTGSATMAGIYSSFDDYEADIYIIEGGLNDASLSTGATSFTAAIDNFLAAIRAVNGDAEIYFITPPLIQTTGGYENFLFPIEFYRIGIWACSSIKHYGVINGLKWFDVKLRSDNVHPTQDSEEKIGRHIVKALENFGDEETHNIEYSKLKRSDTYVYFECNNGVMNIVFSNLRLKATANHNYVGSISSLSTMDTVFTNNGVAVVNSSTGNVGFIYIMASQPDQFTYYSYGVTTGGNMYTDTYRLPVRVRAWESPYL